MALAVVMAVLAAMAVLVVGRATVAGWEVATVAVAMEAVLEEVDWEVDMTAGVEVGVVMEVAMGVEKVEAVMEGG